MIQKIKLLHYLSEETYKKICNKLGLDFTVSKSNKVTFECEKISQIELYHIDYKKFGHIWFMDVEIDFPKFCCSYHDFEYELYAYYAQIFDREIMSFFPSYDELCCEYIEYSSILQISNPADIKNRLLEKCAAEQLDKSLWGNYKKPHGTIEFCLSLSDHILETLARCHGTALKRSVTDPALQKTVGLLPKAAISEETESKILNCLYKRYNIQNI